MKIIGVIANNKAINNENCHVRPDCVLFSASGNFFIWNIDRSPKKPMMEEIMEPGNAAATIPTR
jgi:hypothetical protein